MVKNRHLSCDLIIELFLAISLSENEVGQLSEAGTRKYVCSAQSVIGYS